MSVSAAKTVGTGLAAACLLWLTCCQTIEPTAQKAPPPTPGPTWDTTACQPGWKRSLFTGSSAATPEHLYRSLTDPARFNGCWTPPTNEDGIPLAHRHPIGETPTTYTDRLGREWPVAPFVGSWIYGYEK